MQWRKHVRIKYGGRVGVGQGQREREQGQLQVRVVQLQREGGARLSYVCHQPQLSSTARRSCSAAAMLCCGRRKVSPEQNARLTRGRTADTRAPATGDGTTIPRMVHPSESRCRISLRESPWRFPSRGSRVRMSLDCLETPRRIFKSAEILTTEQVTLPYVKSRGAALR